MGLVDLKTDLKSLKFGKDRVGAGNSGLPYVKTPIPESFNDIGNTGGLDQLTRGGSLIPSSTAADVQRVSRFLETSEGFNFIAKQQGLYIAEQIRLYGLNPSKWKQIYNPLSPVINTGLAPTGQHLANTFYIGRKPSENIPRETKYDEGNTYQNDRVKRTASKKVLTDKITTKPLYISQNAASNLQDTVDFRIVKINNDGSGNNTYIHFRSYIEGLSDKYGASWSTKKYMGRGEDFYSYDGFSRDISFNFKVPILSSYEQKAVYSKLNYLASLCAPDYSSGGFMRGNLIKLTIGDYLVDVPGIFSGISYTFPDDAGWDIARGPEGNKITTIDSETGGLVMPKLIEVSGFTFKPIHNFIPKTVSQQFVETGEGKYIDAPFISYGNTKGNQDDSKYGYNNLV
jgi:hypothetical protein